MRVAEWTSGSREAPEPLEGNVRATVLVLTLVWAGLFLVQLPFYAWFRDGGHEWWIWTCLAGAGLGLVGLRLVRHRGAAPQGGTAPPAATDGAPEDTTDGDTGGGPAGRPSS